MKTRRATLAALALALLADLASAAPPRRDAKPPLQPVSPQSAVRCLSEAYGRGSIAGIGALLTADYVFHFSQSDTAGAGYLRGFDREHELTSIRRMFEGVPGEGGFAAVRDVKVKVARLEESPDPEHPDSLAQYRVVVARRFEISMQWSEDEIAKTLPATQVFSLVRGDVARLVDGQPRLTNRWYVRRWMEDLESLHRALGGTDGRCDDAAPAEAESALPVAFGVRPVNSPLCPTLEVVCDLATSEAATLEVFDLQGRRMARQVLRPAGPGPLRVAAGSGQRFAPGAYWLRLVQGHRPPDRRLVIVAR